MTIQTAYLKPVFELDSFQKTIDKTLKVAETLMYQHQIDSIAFSGISGAAMAFILSHKLNLQLLCVRKTSDACHFHEYYQKKQLVEGNISSARYMIVDDFMDTGGTVDNILKTVRKEAPQAKCTDILFYARSNGLRDYFSNPDAGSFDIPITWSGL